MVNLRAAREEDIDALCALEASCFADAWTRAAILAHEHNEATRTYVAEEGGEVLGALFLSCLPPEGEVYRLSVREDARRRGLGRALMRYGMARLFFSGVRQMFLDVRVGNAPARALYLSLGFGEAGRRARYYRNPIEDAILMEKELTLDDLSGY